MSAHEILVCKIEEVQIHPNADRLDLARIGGYWSIVKRQEYAVGDLCVFIPPDYLVPLNRPEFEFLKEKTKEGAEYSRIKAARFRGEKSWGLIVPAPEGVKEGTNIIEDWDILRYEPVEGGSTGGDNEEGPNLDVPHYGLENLQKYINLLSEKDEVILTGKIHGSNGRFVWHNGRMYCGSHRKWKYAPGHVFSDNHVASSTNWWICLRQNPWIEDFCKENPDEVLFGEIFGPGIQGSRFHYGLQPNQIGFAVFDVLCEGKWVPNSELFDNPKYEKIQKVEVLYRGPYNYNVIQDLAEQKETFNNAGHIREGVVVKSVDENSTLRVRPALKYVSIQYFEKSK